MIPFSTFSFLSRLTLVPSSYGLASERLHSDTDQFTEHKRTLDEIKVEQEGRYALFIQICTQLINVRMRISATTTQPIRELCFVWVSEQTCFS